MKDAEPIEVENTGCYFPYSPTLNDFLSLNNDDLELIARLVSAAINAYGRAKDTTTLESVHDQFERLILLGSKIQSMRDLMQGEADNIAAELGE